MGRPAIDMSTPSGTPMAATTPNDTPDSSRCLSSSVVRKERFSTCESAYEPLSVWNTPTDTAMPANTATGR